MGTTFVVMSAGSCPMQPVTGQARPYPRRIGARRTGNHLPVPLLYRTATERTSQNPDYVFIGTDHLPEHHPFRLGTVRVAGTGTVSGDSLGRSRRRSRPASKHHHHTTTIGTRKLSTQPKPTAMSTRRKKIPSPTVHDMHTSTRVPRLVHSRPQRGSDVKDEGMTGKNGNTWLITSLTHRQAFR